MKEVTPTANSVTDQEATDQQNPEEELCHLVRKPTKYASSTLFYLMAQVGINRDDEV